MAEEQENVIQRAEGLLQAGKVLEARSLLVEYIQQNPVSAAGWPEFYCRGCFRGHLCPGWPSGGAGTTLKSDDISDTDSLRPLDSYYDYCFDFFVSGCRLGGSSWWVAYRVSRGLYF